MLFGTGGLGPLVHNSRLQGHSKARSEGGGKTLGVFPERVREGEDESTGFLSNGIRKARLLAP